MVGMQENSTHRNRAGGCSSFVLHFSVQARHCTGEKTGCRKGLDALYFVLYHSLPENKRRKFVPDARISKFMKR